MFGFFSFRFKDSLNIPNNLKNKTFANIGEDFINNIQNIYFLALHIKYMITLYLKHIQMLVTTSHREVGIYKHYNLFYRRFTIIPGNEDIFLVRNKYFILSGLMTTYSGLGSYMGTTNNLGIL